ncbi:MAG TPA: dienelactone hydrolase, partial [Nocardioidaceae bacterium]|nr:dienelactone hydrolase [Nocardioidaceae bacterium]
IHEIPGMTPDVIAFAEEVVAQGHTVVMPHLFGVPEDAPTPRVLAREFAKICVNKEFTQLALNETTPLADWLRSLARDLHEDVGGPGVGAVGMCFTGGFALAMMVDAPVIAPVVAQPSAPFALGKKRAADVNLSPRDLEIVKERVAQGCAVLGLRFKDDPAVGRRFDTYRHEFGDNFIAVEFPGRKHNTLTEHRQQEGVDRVLDFLKTKLQ